MMLPRVTLAPVILQTLDIRCEKVAQGAVHPAIGQANLERLSRAMVKSTRAMPRARARSTIAFEA